MSLWHPRRAVMSRYAEGTASNRLLRHVARCEQCTRLLDEETAPPRELTAVLADIVAPRPGFIDEVGPRVLDEVHNRVPFGFFADLFAAGWDTVFLLASQEDDHGDE